MASTNITIRCVEERDFEHWYRMRLALWPDADQPQDEQEMKDYFTSESMTAFVAEAWEDRLIGFLEANIRPYADGCITRNVGYIEGWYVEETYRLQGVGAALVKAAEEWARSK